MRRGVLPPYFAQVLAGSALIVALAVVGTQAFSSRTETQSAPETGLFEAVGEISPSSDDDEDLGLEPEEPAPTSQTLLLKDAAFPVIIGDSTQDEPELRRALRRFRRTVLAIEQEGYAVGVVIRDMGTGAYLAYAPDRDLYSASCIKAPYVTALYERLVDTGRLSLDAVSGLAQPTIVFSDNDAYRALSDTYGREVFVDWAADCRAFKRGGTRYHQLIEYRYSMLRPRQLVRMWQHIYRYLNTGTEAAQQLRSYLQQSNLSPLREGLPEASLTLTKAGWYPTDDGPRYAASNDAGIVEIDGHSYLVVIMTNIPDNLDYLTQLVPGIMSARAVLS